MATHTVKGRKLLIFPITSLARLEEQNSETERRELVRAEGRAMESSLKEKVQFSRENQSWEMFPSVKTLDSIKQGPLQWQVCVSPSI